MFWEVFVGSNLCKLSLKFKFRDKEESILIKFTFWQPSIVKMLNSLKISWYEKKF